MTIWLKVTNDQYELPEIVADSAGQLAQKLGVKKIIYFPRLVMLKEKAINVCIERWL